MAMQPFSNRPAYVESIRGLLRLHEMTESGKDDSPEADAIRDTLERPWLELSEIEKHRITGLSEDLYSITDAPREPLPLNPQCSASSWKQFRPASLATGTQPSIFFAVGASMPTRLCCLSSAAESGKRRATARPRRLSFDMQRSWLLKLPTTCICISSRSANPSQASLSNGPARSCHRQSLAILLSWRKPLVSSFLPRANCNPSTRNQS